jgi:hypothetical protein
VIARNSTRYPDGSAAYLAANQPAPACPAPCPAGQIVLPNLGPATLTVPLRPDEQVRIQRLNQIDLKLAKTFTVRGVTIAPNFEAFNLNNSSKIITYASTAYAISAGSYLRPNSVVQGRIIGVGTSVRW